MSAGDDECLLEEWEVDLLRSSTSWELHEWLAVGAEQRLRDRVCGSVMAVEEALDELDRRGVVLSYAGAHALFGRWARRDRALAIRLVKGLRDIDLIECLAGELTVVVFRTREAHLVLPDLDDSEWGELKDELARRGRGALWRELAAFGFLVHVSKGDRLKALLDSVGGALFTVVIADDGGFWPSIWDGGEGVRYAAERIRGVSGDLSMAAALLREHPEVTLDELVVCAAGLAG